MSSDIPTPAAVNKKVSWWLWAMLVLVCATGIALFLIFRSPSCAPVKEKLTPQQEEAIFSDIRKENFKVPGPERLSKLLQNRK